MDTTKSFRAEYKAHDGAPLSPEQLAALNRYALQPLAAEQIYVRTMALCNTDVDRSHERFTRAVLERLAATLEGKSVLAHHNNRSFPLGLFFACHVETDAAGRSVLMASWYCLKSPENESLRANIDAGIFRHCSIGFTYDTLLCSICGRDYYGYTRNAEGDLEYCRHFRGRDYNGQTCLLTYGGNLERYEAYEGSIVYLGCQRGSEIVKAVENAADLTDTDKEQWLRGERPLPETVLSDRLVNGANPSTTKGSLMEITPEQYRQLQLELDDACEAGTVAIDQAELLAEILADAEKARDEAAERAAAAEEALLAVQDAALAADGALYREDLSAEVTRLAGLVDASKEAARLLAVSQDAPSLKELKDEYQARADKRFPPTGLARAAESTDTALRTPRSPHSSAVV